MHKGKYRVEQKSRYLKVYLTNPADRNIICQSISMLKSVEKVNTHEVSDTM